DVARNEIKWHSIFLSEVTIHQAWVVLRIPRTLTELPVRPEKRRLGARCGNRRRSGGIDSRAQCSCSRNSLGVPQGEPDGSVSSGRWTCKQPSASSLDCS